MWHIVQNAEAVSTRKSRIFLAKRATLDQRRPTFHFRSHGSRDPWDGAQPRMAGLYALQRLLGSHEVHAALRLSQAAGPGDVGCDARAEFPAITVGVAPHVSGLWESEGDGGF
jgi:hypothetical protein